MTEIRALKCKGILDLVWQLGITTITLSNTPKYLRSHSYMSKQMMRLVVQAKAKRNPFGRFYSSKSKSNSHSLLFKVALKFVNLQ